MDFYLGLTGLPGAGKEAVSQLITAELAAHNIRTLHYSLSGPIAVELKRRGLPPDREQYRTVANEVRANLGNGAWAARIAREIRETLAVTKWPEPEEAGQEEAGVFVLIDGVRNPAEIAVFKELWGSRFHLLAVDAPEEVRRRNLTARSSPKDAAVLHHLAAAPAENAGSGGTDNPALAPVLTAEMGIGQPQHGTNVAACIELADWTLDNAEYDKTMRALKAAVRRFVERLVLPLYARNTPVADALDSVAVSDKAPTVKEGEHASPAHPLIPSPAQNRGSVGAPTVREEKGAPVADALGSVGTSVGDPTVREGFVRERPRALVVESDPLWQARLANLLEQEGCAAEFAATYAEAAQKLLAQPSRTPYHLLTVDLHLHGPASEAGGESAAGYDLLQSLHYFDRSLPTILVTAGAAADQISRAFRDFGVRDCQAKGDFAPQAFRARVRALLQTPFYVVAAVDAPPADSLLVGQPSTLMLRIQRDAPIHRPSLGAVRGLLRPPTAAEWPLTVVVNSPDLRLDVQPQGGQLLRVPANYLAEPLSYTLTALAAGNGRIELEFHQRGEFVERLALDVSVRSED